jgi:hypothetical protein
MEMDRDVVQVYADTLFAQSLKDLPMGLLYVF